MLRSRAYAVVSPRALALLAIGCWMCAGIQSAKPQDYDFSGDIVLQTAQLEDWQLVAESSPEPSLDATDDLDNDFDEPIPEALPDDPMLLEQYAGDFWSWRWLPEGLIYHSYWAGVHEPRLALVTFYEASDARTLWDVTLGGRVGILQYGNGDPFSPEGFQIDFYGAAIPRLDTENRQDLDSTDYVFGLPFTWGNEQVQYKIGYTHISSHLGDEYAISHPGTLAQRINYVRDAIEFGASHYIVPAWRLYGELEWAFHRSGGAKPLHLEFGTEVSQPGPTSGSFIPFVALNGRMRQEHDFGGDLAVQAGWLRRNMLGQALRFGLHYYNGKSSQSQFFKTSEEQIGMGVWYDF
jgi:hypothetical protein